jgi:hypothetical protein
MDWTNLEPLWNSKFELLNWLYKALADNINVFNHALSWENAFIVSNESVTLHLEYALFKFSSVISSSVISLFFTVYAKEVKTHWDDSAVAVDAAPAPCPEPLPNSLVFLKLERLYGLPSVSLNNFFTPPNSL